MKLTKTQTRYGNITLNVFRSIIKNAITNNLYLGEKKDLQKHIKDVKMM